MSKRACRALRACAQRRGAAPVRGGTPPSAGATFLRGRHPRKCRRCRWTRPSRSPSRPRRLRRTPSGTERRPVARSIAQNLRHTRAATKHSTEPCNIRHTRSNIRRARCNTAPPLAPPLTPPPQLRAQVPPVWPWLCIAARWNVRSLNLRGLKLLDGGERVIPARAGLRHTAQYHTTRHIAAVTRIPTYLPHALPSHGSESPRASCASAGRPRSGRVRDQRSVRGLLETHRFRVGCVGRRRWRWLLTFRTARSC